MLARRPQVSANTLRRWRDEFVAAGRDRLTGQGEAAAAALENKRLVQELAERELILGEITVANRFLQKKGAGALGTTTNGKSGRPLCKRTSGRCG